MIKTEDLKKLAVSSVNGQQHKGCMNGKWYKLDKYGYESAAEAICADLNYALGVKDYVEYRECVVSQNGFPLSACVSDDFSIEGYKIVTLEELAALKGMRKELNCLSGNDPIHFLSDFLNLAEKMVGTSEVRDYILDLLWLDCLYYNVDRHINNFSFYLGKDILFTPYYDFGEALFSDLRIFKGVEDENIARTYLQRWPINPLQFPLAETVTALKYFKPFPYDLNALRGISISSVQKNVIERAKLCLKLTTQIILMSC